MKLVNTFEAAEIADCHEETVREALRDGSLHGAQKKKRGTWRMEEECVTDWAMNRVCVHRLALAA